MEQENGIAAQIYRENSSSVFVVSVYDSNGSVLSLGSGFLIGKNALVTSLHVIVEGGDIFVGQGETRVPAAIVKRDSLNDLAIISVAAELSAKPFVLSERDPVPGESIFAIGNPDGLEKSISAGIVAGLRDFDGRKLLQITAPISHGSSGGPVLSASGEVIGVTVAMFSDGQNLNFAVPADEIRHLIAGDPPTQATVLALLKRSSKLCDQQRTQPYSDDRNSLWQTAKTQIDSLLRSAIEKAGNNPDLLLEVAKEAQYHNADIQIAAAKRALRIRQSPELYILLGEGLDIKAGSDRPAQTDLFSRAESSFRSAIKMQASAQAYYNLAHVLEERGMLLESVDQFVTLIRAKDSYLKALSMKKGSVPTALDIDAWRALVRLACVDRAVVPDQATYFQLLVTNSAANGLDWERRADFLFGHGEFANAGEAYLEAVNHGGFWESWCNAADAFWTLNSFGKLSEDERSWNLDKVLSTARKCVDEGSKNTGVARALAIGHKMIFNVLYARGVYSEALSHAKDGAEIDPADPWLFHNQAEALHNLRRFDDGIQASNQALRLSDGKYGRMHSQLGLSYFEVGNWDSAEQSFEKAAELDTDDPAAAFNTALCQLKTGHSLEALKWFNEVLRRDPKYEDRDEVRRQIRLISRENQ